MRVCNARVCIVPGRFVCACRRVCMRMCMRMCMRVRVYVCACVLCVCMRVRVVYARVCIQQKTIAALGGTITQHGPPSQTSRHAIETLLARLPLALLPPQPSHLPPERLPGTPRLRDRFRSRSKPRSSRRRRDSSHTRRWKPAISVFGSSYVIVIGWSVVREESAGRGYPVPQRIPLLCEGISFDLDR